MIKLDTLDVGGKQYPIQIFFERRTTTRASIGKKAIILRIPISLNREQIAHDILQMKLWAKQQLLKTSNHFNSSPKKIYQHGDTLQVGDEKYLLHITAAEKQSSSIKIIGNTLYLTISVHLPDATKQEHISTLLSRCIARKRLPELKKRIDTLNQKHFNKTINKIFFKNISSRWGSCSSKGNINISTRLLFAPNDVLEYVCVHELAHLLEQNHSDNFWSLVEQVMPAYKENIQWLKEHGTSCIF